MNCCSALDDHNYCTTTFHVQVKVEPDVLLNEDVKIEFLDIEDEKDWLLNEDVKAEGLDVKDEKDWLLNEDVKVEVLYVKDKKDSKLDGVKSEGLLSRSSPPMFDVIA